MKKLFAVMFVSGIVLFPAFSHAQTASTTEELQAQYQQTLVQLINLLLEKVASLQAQLADVQNDVHSHSTTSTTPVSTGNAQDNTVVASWDVSVDAAYASNDRDNQPRYTVTISSEADKVAMDLTEVGTNRLVIGTGFDTLNNGKQVMSEVGLIPGKSYTWKIQSMKDGKTRTDTGSFTVASSN